MKTAIYANLMHCSSTDIKPMHGKCPEGESSWCFYKRAIAKGETPGSHSSMKTYLSPQVVEKIMPVYQRLASDTILERCVAGKTQNSNESLHSCIWRKCPKRDVEEFVKTCDSCGRVGKPRDKAKAPLKLVPIISEVFSKINIYAVGPLPVSTKQNRYLITSICVASKYPEAIPVESITSPNVIDALLSIFSRLGFPREIQSDLGTSFTSELTTTFFNKFGIKVTRSSVSHPKAMQWSECIEPSRA
ncbi:retrovirus-related Pol polyprotein from transposon 17.6 [Trichonephila clavipes]|nr:retrovirus-related Pol polyprotein from transposon 17.6 [Trichonephila clavipes]